MSPAAKKDGALRVWSRPVIEFSRSKSGQDLINVFKSGFCLRDDMFALFLHSDQFINITQLIGTNVFCNIIISTGSCRRCHLTEPENAVKYRFRF